MLFHWCGCAPLLDLLQKKIAVLTGKRRWMVSSQFAFRNLSSWYNARCRLNECPTICWPCISSLILVNDQPDTLFHVFIYSFHLSTCFERQVLIIRKSNCINTSSGMISLCECLVCRSGGTSWPAHQAVTYRLIIPDDVLIQFDLLMMSTWCSKHVERRNE